MKSPKTNNCNDVIDRKRNKMVNTIALLLLSKKKIVSKEWLIRLPKMSKAIEIILFRRSPSLEDYLNTSSLKDRIKIIAEDVASMHLRKINFKKNQNKPLS